jgi:superfamily II DNA or RNA helicase
MSEEELKKTEKKQVIFASYSMCSEGLDIPTLNAEFLITPKTDVIQIVGRILRAKHAFASPVIYDFIDTHEVFRKQWLKRKAYYKKQNYRINEMDSHDYNSVDITTMKKWETGFSKKEKNGDELDLTKDSPFIGKCLISIKK